MQQINFRLAGWTGKSQKIIFTLEGILYKKYQKNYSLNNLDINHQIFIFPSLTLLQHTLHFKID